uniref:Transient receptor potential cation channel, subfamily V, member 6 n=1 Tax=Astyanax mexicanus TaxID=7994 RepID=A0A8B9GXK5_ASTMX
MSPTLMRSAPREINHWWSQIRFRLQNRKGWNEMLDETFFLQAKCVNDIPLFYEASVNNVGCIKKLLDCATTNIFERGENFPSASFTLYCIQFSSLVYLEKSVLETTKLSCFLVLHISVGEHILAFASCIGNTPIISMLISAGANIRAQDSLGNTILHILVMQPNKIISCQIFDLLLTNDEKTDPTIPLDKIPNYRGLTPFKLAAKKGNVVAFQHMVNSRRIVQWNLGCLTSYLYDLTEIDSRTDDMSVLELIVCSQKREARSILQVTPVQELITLKWNLYGKYYFRLLLLVYLLYIGTFTLCCMHRPLKDIPENYTKSEIDQTVKIQKTVKESYVTYADHLRLVGEIISVVGALIILLLEVGIVATTLMLEQRLPRSLWPRLGVSGLLYGLGDRWYLRVEDRSDQFVQKIRRYAKILSHNEETGNNQSPPNNDSVQEVKDTKETKDTSHPERKSLQCWEILRQSVLRAEKKNKEHLDSVEMKCV